MFTASHWRLNCTGCRLLFFTYYQGGWRKVKVVRQMGWLHLWCFPTFMLLFRASKYKELSCLLKIWAWVKDTHSCLTFQLPKIFFPFDYLVCKQACTTKCMRFLPLSWDQVISSKDSHQWSGHFHYVFTSTFTILVVFTNCNFYLFCGMPQSSEVLRT